MNPESLFNKDGTFGIGNYDVYIAGDSVSKNNLPSQDIVRHVSINGHMLRVAVCDEIGSASDNNLVATKIAELFTKGTEIDILDRTHIQKLLQAATQSRQEPYMNADSAANLSDFFIDDGKLKLSCSWSGDVRTIQIRDGKVIDSTLDDNYITHFILNHDKKEAKSFQDEFANAENDEDIDNIIRRYFNNIQLNKKGLLQWLNVTQGLIGSKGNLNHQVFDLEDGDIVLTLTDGITDVLTYKEIEILASKSLNPKELAAQLIKAAELKSVDNSLSTFRKKKDDRAVKVIEVTKKFELLTEPIGVSEFLNTLGNRIFEAGNRNLQMISDFVIDIDNPTIPLACVTFNSPGVVGSYTKINNCNPRKQDLQHLNRFQALNYLPKVGIEKTETQGDRRTFNSKALFNVLLSVFAGSLLMKELNNDGTVIKLSEKYIGAEATEYAITFFERLLHQAGVIIESLSK